MYEPLPGNYAWDLAVNICVGCGGALDEIPLTNVPLLEAAQSGADAGTVAFIDSRCALADRLVAHAREDNAAGHNFSDSHKHARACADQMTPERMQRHGFASRELARAKISGAMDDPVWLAQAAEAMPAARG